MESARDEIPASLGELGLCLRRSWRWILGWTVLGITLGLVFLGLVRPSFRARATILIERENASGLLGDLAILASLTSAPAAASGGTRLCTMGRIWSRNVPAPESRTKRKSSGCTATMPSTPGVAPSKK